LGGLLVLEAARLGMVEWDIVGDGQRFRVRTDAGVRTVGEVVPEFRTGG
jgi:hypothetical protein